MSLLLLFQGGSGPTYVDDVADTGTNGAPGTIQSQNTLVGNLPYTSRFAGGINRATTNGFTAASTTEAGFTVHPASRSERILFEVRHGASPAGVQGFIFRGENASPFNDYWYVYRDSSGWNLQRVVAGTDTNQGTWANTRTANSTENVQIDDNGTSISVAINGTTRITASDTTHNTQTGIGPYFFNQTAGADHIYSFNGQRQSTGTNFNAAVATSTASSQSVSLQVGKNIDVGTGTATATGQTATSQVSTTFSAALATATATHYSVSLQVGQNLAAGLATATTQSYAVGLQVGKNLAAALSTATATHYGVTLRIDLNQFAGAGSATSQSYTVGLQVGKNLGALLAIATAQGNAVTVIAGRTFDASLATATAQSNPVTLSIPRSVLAATATATASALGITVVIFDTVGVFRRTLFVPKDTRTYLILRGPPNAVTLQYRVYKVPGERRIYVVPIEPRNL